MTTLTRTYPTELAARRAVEALRAIGVPERDIRLLARTAPRDIRHEPVGGFAGFVHTRRVGPDGRPRRCWPRRDAPVCEHCVRLSCGRVHTEDDPCLGEPICRDCFNHAGAVIWNNALSELWRRTTSYLPHVLAGLTGMTHKSCASSCVCHTSRSPNTSAVASCTCTP